MDGDTVNPQSEAMLMRQLERREFLGGGAVLTVPSKPVRFGLIGCGGRGTRVATVMVQEAGAQIVALADLFQDKLDSAKRHFDGVLKERGLAPIDTARLYRGSESHLRLAASDLDAVVVALPPYFYPQVLDGLVRIGSSRGRHRQNRHRAVLLLLGGRRAAAARASEPR
jgi:hypothetical protein